MQKKEISYERNGVLKCLRLFITITLMATTLLTHAQCMRVHYNDGWTEQIDVTTVDSITFDENGQHLAPTIMLNNGLRMPAFGIGTYSLHGETCFNSVYTALKNGYRLIDTAYMYGNEEEVGRAVRQAVSDGICKREDVTVITKIYPGTQFANPELAIQERIDRLNIGYVDIMLLHHPGDNDVKAYRAMEKQVEAGGIHSLGISCFYIDELKRFLPQVSIKPVLVQNEIHPYYQDTEVVDYIHSQGIVVQAWYPLGGRGYQTELLSDPVLKRIAETHGKSLVQVVLRWH
jgi:diketogulonate reductase-like aldo/keto reductase